MDHRPFESWLLESKRLDADDKRQLDAHLQVCPRCAALAEVDLALKSTRQAAPAPGFGERFQVRLAARKQAIRRRNIWGFVVLTFSVLGLLAWISWPLIEVAARSPVDLLASWLAALVTFWASLQAMFQAGSVFFEVIPDFIPFYVFPLLFFFAAGWSLIWIFSLMKLTKLTQGV
jgi:anti-sigma factor RsiW